MKRWLISVPLIVGAWGCQEPSRDEGVGLAVVLVVDQMRADYIDRFDPFFEGGLRRLLDEGVVFGECRFGHAMTGTSPGHASLATGCDPRSHGVFEQYWYDRDLQAQVEFTLDADHQLVSAPASAVSTLNRGGRSPRHLATSTLGDWLRGTNPDSKVFSTAIKARASIAMGGHKAQAAYWYDPDLPGMVSSTYYLDALPDWVHEFNHCGKLQEYRAEGWNRFRPLVNDPHCREDHDQAEADGVSTTFPHHFDDSYAHQLRFSPHGDDLTLQFAELLIGNEELGRDDAVDLLWVGLSSADYVGHLYGPFSLEVMDYYLRLDHYLHRFFEKLDDEVGRGRYTVVLSSDHGVAPLPESQARVGTDARRVVNEEFLAELDAAAQRLATRLELPENPFDHCAYEGVVLNPRVVGELSWEELEREVVRELEALPFIDRVFTRAELAGISEDPHLRSYQRSYVPGRGPDLMFCFPEFWLVGTYSGGTNHGTPYSYDTHVPLIVLAPNLESRRVDERVEPIDAAPTLAELLNVPIPPGRDGRSLVGLLQ